MAEIIPSILEENIENFNARYAEILKIPDLRRVQIDFSDGDFTKHKTLMPGDIDLLNPAYAWEAHLMANQPEKYFFDLQVAGFNCVIVHYEALKDLSAIENVLDRLREMNIAPGLALNPETNIEKIINIATNFESVLVMGVHPGWQGREILPETFVRVKKLKNALKNVIIEVDGGVKINNIRELFAAGAERMVVNSALFEKSENGQVNPAQNYEKLKLAVN